MNVESHGDHAVHELHGIDGKIGVIRFPIEFTTMMFRLYM